MASWTERGWWWECGCCEEDRAKRYLVWLQEMREEATTEIISKFLQLKSVGNMRTMTWFGNQNWEITFGHWVSQQGFYVHPPLPLPTLYVKMAPYKRKPLSLIMAFRPSRTGPTFLPASFPTRYHVPQILLFPSVSSMPFPNLLSHPCFLARGKRWTSNSHPPQTCLCLSWRHGAQIMSHSSLYHLDLSTDRYHIFHILVSNFPKQNPNSSSDNMKTEGKSRQISRHTMSAHQKCIVYKFVHSLIDWTRNHWIPTMPMHTAGTQ